MLLLCMSRQGPEQKKLADVAAVYVPPRSKKKKLADVAAVYVPPRSRKKEVS